MARLRLFHRRAEEAKPLLTLLQAAGCSVDYKEPVSSYREVRLSPPDAIVIDLSRPAVAWKEAAVFLAALTPRSPETTCRPQPP
jgi:hypothetical protein